MGKITDKSTDKRLKNLKPKWKKGESANPNGRPLGQKNYATLYREALIKLGQLNGKEPDEIELEMIANGLASARKGDFRFYKDTMDRLHGDSAPPAPPTTILVKFLNGDTDTK